MNLNKKIGFLLDKGLNPKYISTLNEGKISLLFEKMSKGEPKEAVQTTQQTGYKTTISPGSKANLQIDGTNISSSPDKGITIQSTKAPVGTGEQTEGKEIKEKFESKAQQGLFWARCNKCKDENCKWCKMAEEFSDKTTKKDYKDMPEKKHPEKTVKYKKKETNEVVDYNKALGAAVTAGLKGNLSKLVNPKFNTSESKLRNQLENIIERNLTPTMKKSDLIRLIEATMGDTKEKTKETETEKEEKKKTGNPFRKPKEKDAPEAKGDTKEKTKETETEKEEKKKTGNPFRKPKEKDAPEAKGEQKEGLDYFMSQVKKSGLI
jgi:hypothetical protein